MKIYTSYFANIKKLPANIIPIAICGTCPYWYKGLQYKKLAPSYSILTEWLKNHDEKLYIERFNSEVLNKLNCDDVISDLLEMSNGNDVALICYEKPTDFCHRHLVATWLSGGFYEVTEWVNVA